MFRKFLFYFANILCLGTIVSCTRAQAPEERPNEPSVRWIIPSTTNGPLNRSLRTVSRKGLYRIAAGTRRPEPATVFTAEWTDGQNLQITFPKSAPFTAEKIALGIRVGFQSQDPVLVDALTDILVNGKEFSEGKIPWSMVGVKILSPIQLQIQLRRKAPLVLELALSHPDTWVVENEGAPFQPVVVEEPLTRAQLLLESEGTFTEGLPPELLPLLKAMPAYHEKSTGVRLALLVNPLRPALAKLTNRRILLSLLDPRDFVKRSTIPVEALKSALTRETVSWTGRPFDGEKAERIESLPSLTLLSWSPLSDESVQTALHEALTHLSAQLGRAGIGTTLAPLGDAKRGLPSLSAADLVLIAMPSPPLLARSWGELFWQLAELTSARELEDLLNRWIFSRDDERLEIAMERILTQDLAIFHPYVEIRKGYLSLGSHLPELSPFGHWDWSRVASR